MNWANRVTMIRIFLIPVIGILMTLQFYGHEGTKYYDVVTKGIDSGNYHLSYMYLAAGILFVIASLSDMLDGYIARKFNQVTTFGKFFDSIADKLLTNAVVIIFGITHVLPIWMVVLLVCRDFVIDVVRQILASSKVIMAANQLGRYRAAFEMIGLTILFFVGFFNFDGLVNATGKFDEYGWVNQIVMIPMYIATILSIAAAVNYMYLNRKILFAGARNDEKEIKNEK
jgi:CDP-diacylglycerol--glycerol-3-phosphate 3-phosphatidyltransferase